MKPVKFLMGTVLLAFGSFLIVSCGKTEPPPAAPSTARIEMMVQDWERAKLFTKAYIDSSDDKTITFKVTPTVRSFGDQLLHIAEANYGLVQAATKKGTDMGFGKLEGKLASKAEVSKAVLDSYDYVIAALKEMNDGMLADTCSISFGPDFKKTMSKELMINKTFEHQTHHRGQATQYLRENGKTPPEEMLF